MYYVHIQGFVTYCRWCPWKKIFTDDDIIYENEKCECHNTNHPTTLVSICPKTNTMVYLCKECTTNNKSPIKHLYIYPHNDETNDNDPLYLCPIKEKAVTIPTIHSLLQCTQCSKNISNCYTMGYLWHCYCCNKEQLRLITTPTSYIHTSKRKRFDNCGVCWQCKKCASINV